MQLPPDAPQPRETVRRTERTALPQDKPERSKQLPSDAPQPRSYLMQKVTKKEGYGIFLHEEKGMQRVKEIDKDSPAESAGLTEGDIIFAVNGVSIQRMIHEKMKELIKQDPLRCELLVIDEEGAQWYKKNDIAISPSQPNIIRMGKVAETKSPSASITTNGLDDLSDQCCCSICCETFDSVKNIPRVLDCGHTFCQVCIYNKKMRVNTLVKCPNCSKIISVPDGKDLPINYTVIGMAEQLLKSRSDPKIACKQCKTPNAPSGVRLCIKKDCAMFNQILCLSCVVDGGHGGHVVKYDVNIDKIRNELRLELQNICGKVEFEKKTMLNNADQLIQLIQTRKKKLSDSTIPAHVRGQLDNITSEQEASEYRENIKDLEKTLIGECKTIAEVFSHTVAELVKQD